jgi:hypothetical protein
MKSKNMTKKVRKPNNYYQAKAYEPEYKRGKICEPYNRVSLDTNENDDPKAASPALQNENSQDSVINVDKDDSPPVHSPVVASPHSILSQPSSSAFYPYVDPLSIGLSYFIDLKVSAGQERKKESYQAMKNNHILLDSNSALSNSIISKNRIGSAFKVPSSTNNESPNSSFSAINLISSSNQRCDDTKNENIDDVDIFDLESKSKIPKTSE